MFEVFISVDVGRVYCFGFVSLVSFGVQLLSGVVLSFVFQLSLFVFWFV